MISKSHIFILFIILIYSSSCHGFFEVIAGFASYLMAGSCTDKEIPADFRMLKHTLENKLYGQPLVINTVMSALRSHWQSKSDKALTMSFHGGAGIGKTYVSQLIQEALYKDGSKSPHAHFFTSRLVFPEERKVPEYKVNLANWIRGNVTKCPKQLFIFDEVHTFPPGLLDAIKPFIDYIDNINGISYRESIFIFLSNLGAGKIVDRTTDLWNQGIHRKDFKLMEFESMIMKASFNEGGGFHGSETITSNLIDHYIPFLPLMESHVRLCIREEFKKRGVSNPSEYQINEVLDYIEWGPDSVGIFSKTGCKRISQKVALLTF